MCLPRSCAAFLGADRANTIASSLSSPRRTDGDTRTMLEAVGRLWLAGVPVAWTEMAAGDAARRVPLPTYPFERTRYAVDAAPVAPAIAAGDNSAQMDRSPSSERMQRLYAPSWMRDESVSAAAPRVQGVWIVLADRTPLAEAVVEMLREAGATPILAEAGTSYERLDAARFRMRPDDPEDVEPLLAEIGPHGPVAGALVLLDAVPPDATFASSPTRGYAALVSLAAGSKPWRWRSDLVMIVVTCGAQSVLDEPVVQPDAALLVRTGDRAADGNAEHSHSQRGRRSRRCGARHFRHR